MTQLEMTFTPREQGEQAAQACLGAAERRGFDTEGAMRFVVGHLARHGQQSGELIVDAAVAHGFRPLDTRAFGSVFASLVRKGQIRCVGYCDRQKGHGTAGGRVWSLVL